MTNPSVWRNPYLIRLMVLGIGCFIAPWFSPMDPLAINDTAMLAAPSWHHWLGTDHFGRDILSRILAGSRQTVGLAFVAVFIAAVLGSLLGIAAALGTRWGDLLLGRLFDGLYCFPDILVALAIVAVLGPGDTNIVFALAVVYVPIFGRVTRARVLTIRSSDFVTAARATGSPKLRIVFRHIIPVLSHTILAQFGLCVGFAILAQAALSYLGVAGQPDQPAWGIMVKDGVDWLEHAWWASVFPGLAITLVVLLVQWDSELSKDR